MQKVLNLGNGSMKDVLLYPRVENLLPGRLQEESTPCCPLGLRLFLGHEERSFYECYNLRCGFSL